MTKKLTLRSVFILLFLFMLPVALPAKTYNLPNVDVTSNNSAFKNAGCTVSGDTINCTNNLILGNKDELVLTDTSSPITLNLDRDWTFGAKLEVNINGESGNLTISVQGNVNPGNKSIINANLSIGGSLNSGNKGSLEGGLTIGGNLNLGNNASIEGIVTIDGAANIGNNVTIDGDLSANNVNLGPNTIINGNVEGNDVTLNANTEINGSVNASGTVNNNGGTITGYVNASNINDNGGDIQGATCDQNSNVGPCSGLTEDSDTSPGLSTYTVPAGVNSITIELWGAGGAASLPAADGSNTTSGGGGGGGGAFVRRHLSTQAGDVFEYFLGNGAGPNRDSWLRRQGQGAKILIADGGQSASGQTGGAAGQAGQSLGADKQSGGSGASGTADGGGGGSSAGNSTSGSSGSGVSGGTAPAFGGNGGDGATQSSAAQHGGVPGGGGGGGLECNDTAGCSNAAPGDGGNGKVRFIYGEATAPGDLHHIDLAFDTTGLTCQATPVKVRACVDANCSAVITDSVTLSLTASNGNWDGGSSLTFTNSADVDFVFPSANENDTATLGATNISPAPQGSPAVTCNDGTNCSITMTEAALLITDASGDPINLRNTTAGTKESGYYLSAVRKSDKSASCQAAIQNASQPVRFSASIGGLDNLPSTDQVHVNNTPIDTYLGSSSSASQAISFAFDANGRTTTPFDIRWDDVGKVTLNTATDVSILGTASTDTLSLINGGPFVVAPHSLQITDWNCSSTVARDRANGDPDVFCRAGEDFFPILTGYDTNNNEVQNLGHESSPDIYSFEPIPSSSSDDLDSEPPNTLTWLEVGRMELKATLENYLGGSNGPLSATAEIGRFVPDRFEVDWENWDHPNDITITPAQSLGESPGSTVGITYFGQPANWNPPPLNITAYSTPYTGEPEGTKTENYDGEFMRFESSADIGIAEPVEFSATSHNVSFRSGSIDYLSQGGGVVQLTPDLDLSIDKTENPGAGGQHLQPFVLNVTISPDAFTDQDGVPSPDYSQSETEAIGDGYLGYARLRLDNLSLSPEKTVANMPVRMDLWCDPEETAAAGTAFPDWIAQCNNLGNQSGFLYWPADIVHEGLDPSAFESSAGTVKDAEGNGVTITTAFDRENPDDFSLLKITLTYPGSTTPQDRLEYQGAFTIFGTCDLPTYLRAPWASLPDMQPDHCDTPNTGSVLVGPSALLRIGRYSSRGPVLFSLPQGR